MPEVDPADAAVEARARARLGGLLRGKYRLDRLLGHGGMATVYAATHRNGKEVAVKLLHPELAHVSDMRGRFLREGYVANLVKHPGAVAVLDDDVTDEGEAFLVMELLSGVTVDQLWIDSACKLHAPWVVAIVLQLLDVMAAAHAHGIIHRDLKPENLFLTLEGEIKVLDFGIARMRAQATGARTTNVGVVLGTPAFMAPEQALGRMREIDERTDLWAVGALAFALLVGDVVHPAETAQETLILAATCPARPLGPLAPDVPPGIVAVLDRALAFERGARWPTAARMREALVAAIADAYGELPDAQLLREVLALRRAAPSEPFEGRKTLDLELAAVVEVPRVAASLSSLGIGDPPPAARSAMPSLALEVAVTTREARAPSGAPEPRPPRRRRWTLATAGAVAFVALTLLCVNAARSSSAAGPTATLGPTAAEPLLVRRHQSSRSAAPYAPAMLEPVLTTGLDLFDVEAGAATADPAPDTPPPSAARRMSASAGPKPAAPSAPRAATPSAAVTTAATCAPPFKLDRATGRKKWKIECL